jgi:ATP-binding cassette, subfamily B, bacterial
LTIGVLTASLLYLRMFFEPMQEISQFFNTFLSASSASSALEKLSGVLAERPGVPEPTSPVPLPRVRGELRFDHLTFGYLPERPVLLVLEHGQVVEQGSPVELVGRTGGRYAILHWAWEESLA